MAFVTIYIPEDEIYQFDRLVERSGLSRSALVREGIRLWRREDKRKRRRRKARKK